MCPACSNQLLKVTIIEDGKDVEKYYCDICDTSYDEPELEPNNKNVKLIKKTPISKKNKKKISKKSGKTKEAAKSKKVAENPKKNKP